MSAEDVNQKIPGASVPGNGTDAPDAADDREELSHPEVIVMCENRAGTYALLSRLFRKEADAELLEELKGMLYPVSTGNPSVDAGYRMLARYLSNAWENTLLELGVDYMRTFIGSGRSTFDAAYPNESVYTSPKRLVMQDARDEVMAIYRSLGVAKDESYKESEDHIAIELELCQVLCQRCAEAVRAGEEERAITLLETHCNFLEDHLRAWVPIMTADMLKFSRTDFYKGLAYLTDGFLETESEFFAGAFGQSDETTDEQDS